MQFAQGSVLFKPLLQPENPPFDSSGSRAVLGALGVRAGVEFVFQREEVGERVVVLRRHSEVGWFHAVLGRSLGSLERRYGMMSGIYG